MKKFLSTPRSQLVVFFLIAFIIAWGTWIPAFLLPNFPKQLSMLGLFAPAISGLIVAWMANGRSGIGEVLGRYKKWRFGVQWYGLSIGLIPIFFLLAVLLNGVISARPLEQIWVGSLLPAVLLHASTDIGPRIFQIGKFTPSTWLTIDIFILITAAVLIIPAAIARRAKSNPVYHPWGPGFHIKN